MSRSLGATWLTTLSPIRKRALGDLLEPRDHAQRGGLAAARGADEDHELAVVDLQVQVVDGDDLTELLPDPVERDRSHATSLLLREVAGPCICWPCGQLDGPRTPGRWMWLILARSSTGRLVRPTRGQVGTLAISHLFPGLRHGPSAPRGSCPLVCALSPLGRPTGESKRPSGRSGTPRRASPAAVWLPPRDNRRTGRPPRLQGQAPPSYGSPDGTRRVSPRARQVQRLGRSGSWLAITQRGRSEPEGSARAGVGDEV